VNWVSDCCLTPTQHLFSYIMARTSYFSMRWKISKPDNHIDSVMMSVLTSSVVDRGFEPRSGQPKNYEIGICCFSAKHTSLRRKSKDWLASNQDNVFKRSEMSIRGLLFQWASTMKIQQSRPHHHLIEKSNKYQFHSFWVDPIEARTHDLPHSMHAH
jgi:hypothetical protein